MWWRMATCYLSSTSSTTRRNREFTVLSLASDHSLMHAQDRTAMLLSRVVHGFLGLQRRPRYSRHTTTACNRLISHLDSISQPADRQAHSAPRRRWRRLNPRPLHSALPHPSSTRLHLNRRSHPSRRPRDQVPLRSRYLSRDHTVVRPDLH
jgi:hypothetical protein